MWLGLPEPPAWHLVLYFRCIGMFGAGVGMLYTPILVDRLKLTYPSGLAVANILRALTDERLLRRSVATLGGGTAARDSSAASPALEVAAMAAIALLDVDRRRGHDRRGAHRRFQRSSADVISWALRPYFVSIGWLEPNDPFRKITFIIALGMIMGAAAIDLTLILAERAAPHPRGEPKTNRSAEEAWKRTNAWRLLAWCVVWGIGVVACGSILLGASVAFSSRRSRSCSCS